MSRLNGLLTAAEDANAEQADKINKLEWVADEKEKYMDSLQGQV